MVRVLAVSVGLVILIMLGAVARRMSIDVPNVTAGTLPEDTYDVRFVQHNWIAYLHIGPGLLYLLGACLQLSYRFRSRHYTFHRRLGRVLVGSALPSGVFALIFGIFFPLGGIIQSSAAVAFGLGSGLSDPGRPGDPPQRHVPPPWMIRAFAVGIAVGTIRIWLGIFEGFGRYAPTSHHVTASACVDPSQDTCLPSCDG